MYNEDNYIKDLYIRDHSDDPREVSKAKLRINAYEIGRYDQLEYLTNEDLFVTRRYNNSDYFSDKQAIENTELYSKIMGPKELEEARIRVELYKKKKYKELEKVIAQQNGTFKEEKSYFPWWAKVITIVLVGFLSMCCYAFWILISHLIFGTGY